MPAPRSQSVSTAGGNWSKCLGRLDWWGHRSKKNPRWPLTKNRIPSSLPSSSSSSGCCRLFPRILQIECYVCYCLGVRKPCRPTWILARRRSAKLSKSIGSDPPTWSSNSNWIKKSQLFLWKKSPNKSDPDRKIETKRDKIETLRVLRDTLVTKPLDRIGSIQEKRENPKGENRREKQKQKQKVGNLPEIDRPNSHGEIGRI